MQVETTQNAYKIKFIKIRKKVLHFRKLRVILYCTKLWGEVLLII